MEGEIDESLYSRQLYVMGHEAQRRMAASTVLLVGVNGLGVEVAKNIILAGVKSVTLFDFKNATYDDLSAQFYISESDIGKNRAVVSAPKLAELNPHVAVNVLENFNLEKVKQEFKVVVLIDVTEQKRSEISDFCHLHGVYVVSGDTFGVFGNIFCDFGKDFVVHDTNGENAVSSMISGISCDTRALVTVLEDTRHNLSTGDVISFSEIVGMTELNGQECVVEVKDPFTFFINVDTTNYGAYQRGGYINQIKQPATISFDSFSTSRLKPGEFVVDFAKMHRVGHMHVAFRALDTFRTRHVGALPRPGNRADADEVFAIVQELNAAANESQGEFKLSEKELQDEEKYIKRIALCSRGQVSPVCALMGGIMGQEVLKACSGKFFPVKQWYYYDCSEALSDEPLSEEEVAPIQSRYDGQIMVFGKALQGRLAALNMFLVGAGAIGCEMIKNWAMMGISCSGFGDKAGTVHITDMDQIEKSNLSRQFLFRNKDINRPKSTTAANAVKTMNNQLNTVVYENKVAPDTERLFNDDFFESLDMICTALDNVEARLYIDQKCLFYHKPMLESGTLGAKGHTQIIAPRLTESYGATRDPPEKSIPVCTLKHFPNQIDHTLQWARDWFEEEYSMGAKETQQYLTSTSAEFAGVLNAQQNMRLETLNRIRKALVTDCPHNIEDCVVWARHIFEELFANKVKQLLHNFPLDRMTSAGTPFWSGAKKPPTAIQFDPSDALHAEFILSAALLRAKTYNLIQNFASAGIDAATAASIAARVEVQQFNPQEGVKIAATDEEAKANEQNAAVNAASTDIDVQCDQILSSLPVPAAVKATNFTLTAVDFDKDSDEHMRVVAAVSNLRARNYAIPEADLHTSRGIAGKITPAIATTTALVTGTICMEIYKLIQNKPIEDLRNTFSNLALPLFTSAEPDPPKPTVAKIKGADWKWNQWDRVDVEDPAMTVSGLIELLDDKYGVELSMLSSGVTILFSDFLDRKKMAERKVMTLRTLVETVTKKPIPPEQKYVILELLVNDSESGDEVEFPYLRYKLF